MQRIGGLEPRETDSLGGLLFAPMLHGPWGHLLANTVPLLVFGFLLLLAGVQRWGRERCGRRWPGTCSGCRRWP